MPTLRFGLDHREEYGSYWMYKETSQSNNDCNGLYLKKTLLADEQSAPMRVRITVEWD
jgi:hypothetical protein